MPNNQILKMRKHDSIPRAHTLTEDKRKGEKHTYKLETT